jgi:predicted HicB family RNase H-like nuclease
MKTWAAYALRLPPELKIRLEEAARDQGRSLNTEIVRRLKASLEGYRR